MAIPGFSAISREQTKMKNKLHTNKTVTNRTAEKTKRGRIPNEG